jgi:FKBP-type peptidyl-prolyl cis-trans isomerase SlyD
MVIGPNTVVTLSYTLSVSAPDGTLSPLETRAKQNPIEFFYGHGMLLPAVEKNIEKQTAGYRATLVLPPRDAFGEFDAKLETWYQKDKLPKGVPLQIGLKFQTQGPGGEVISVLLKDIQGDKVLLDGNHPLAGATVEFDFEVLRVRAATAEEAASGQVKARFH